MTSKPGDPPPSPDPVMGGLTFPAGTLLDGWLFQSAYVNVACGILIHDTHGVLIEANNAALEILGAPLEDVRSEGADGPPCDFMRHDGTIVPYRQWPPMLALETAQPQPRALWGLTRRDGSRLTVELSAIPVRGPEGTILHIVTSMLDVTERIEGIVIARDSQERSRAREAAAMAQVSAALAG